MEFFKKYLEKRKIEKEKRRIEEFLNTKVPISELYICSLCIIEERFERRWTNFRHQGYKLLKKIDDAREDDYYIDITTNTKYRNSSSCFVNPGDVVVYQCCIPDFQKKFVEQQYMTISDIIEMNERLKKLEK